MTVPEAFQDLDAMLAMAITREDVREPFRGADEIAVRAIVALSHAGAGVYKDAARMRPGSAERERLTKRARNLMDLARQLMSELAIERQER